MAAAIMFCAMAVMAAANIGIKGQLPGQEGFHCFVRVAADAAAELNAGFRQGCPGTATDAAADEHIHLGCPEETSQRAVAMAVGVRYHRADDAAVRHIIDLELGCVTEVLVNLVIFVSDCNSHFLFFLFAVICCMIIAPSNCDVNLVAFRFFLHFVPIKKYRSIDKQLVR